MKILDIPQSGKRGVTVSQDGAFGQISRALVIPGNPRIEGKLNRRQVLGTMAHNCGPSPRSSGWLGTRRARRSSSLALARPQPSTWFGGTPPKSAGRFRPSDYYYLGELTEVVGGKANITALYTAKFGAPAAAQKVFVRSKQVLDGYDDLPHQWSGIVPAAS